MWPLILAAGGLAALIFGTKNASAKTGPTILAETTTKLGQPVGTQNWPAPSGRVYRVTHWNTAGGQTLLVLGGSWAAQPSAPNAYWLIQITPQGTPTSSSLEPDATARQDLQALLAAVHDR